MHALTKLQNIMQIEYEPIDIALSETITIRPLPQYFQNAKTSLPYFRNENQRGCVIPLNKRGAVGRGGRVLEDNFDLVWELCCVMFLIPQSKYA